MNRRISFPSPLPALVFAAALAATDAGAQEAYSVDAAHTIPTFEVTHFGMSTQRGMFGKVTGRITLDRAAGTGSADIAIDMASVVSPVPKLLEHLRSDDFFGVEKHPVATFKSGRFRFEGDRLVEVAGDLTLRGVSRPVTLTVTAFRCGAHPINKKAMCGADATVTIKRSDFGISKYIPAVGDDVKLSIPVEAFRD